MILPLKYSPPPSYPGEKPQKLFYFASVEAFAPILKNSEMSSMTKMVVDLNMKKKVSMLRGNNWLVYFVYASMRHKSSLMGYKPKEAVALTVGPLAA